MSGICQTFMLRLIPYVSFQLLYNMLHGSHFKSLLYFDELFVQLHSDGLWPRKYAS